MTDIREKALQYHESHQGKIAIKSKVRIESRADLSLAYTPGVAEVAKLCAKDNDASFTYTNRQNTVAVISDGSAVLGLGNIGPFGAYPVMEGKCVLFKELADIDAFPICLATQDTDEIINTVRNIAPVFGGINLEDISAPKCFEIESALLDLGIPIMHDDQHGSAIAVLAALINALKVTKKKKEGIKVVISGAGAAGSAVARMLLNYGIQNILICDSKGIISQSREDLNTYKIELASVTNKQDINGSLADAVKGADVFIGLSQPGVLTSAMIKTMNSPIVFALANPVPEVMPNIALAAGAQIVGTGRSDFPNQINNSLAFPGVFKGALKANATKINEEMKIAAARALAECVEHPTIQKIVPEPLDKEVVSKIADAVSLAAQQTLAVRKRTLTS